MVMVVQVLASSSVQQLTHTRHLPVALVARSRVWSSVVDLTPLERPKLDYFAGTVVESNCVHFRI